jgi:hypothetical protein
MTSAHRRFVGYGCLSIALSMVLSGCGEPEVEPNDTAFEVAANSEQPILDLGADDWAAWGVLTSSEDVDTWLIADQGDGMEGLAERAPIRTASPLKSSPVPHPLHAFGVKWLDFDRQAYAKLATAAHEGRGARIEALQVSDEIVVELDLKPIEVFTDDVDIVAARMIDGVVENRAIDRPDLILLEGTVTGIEDSEVFLSISPRNSNGWVRIRDRTYMIATELENPARRPIVYDLGALPEAFVPKSEFSCGGGLEVPGITDLHPVRTTQQRRQRIGGSGVTEYRLALDGDTEYLQDLFEGSINEAVAYAATLVAATNTILVRDVQSRLKISYVRMWEGEDPWNATDTENQLYDFTDAWNRDMEAVDRDLVHMLSGRALGGGIAWIDVLCWKTYGYAISANLNGSFPIPLSESTENWDIYVFAHETGHNYGARHTHELTPPVDGCGNGDCSQPHSTLMSYCHFCYGGIGNVELAFHPRSRLAMRSGIESGSCGHEVDDRIELNGFFTVLEDRWAMPVIYRVDYLDPGRELIAKTPIHFEYFLCPFSDNDKNDACMHPFGTSLMLDPDQTYLIEVTGSDDTFYNFGFVRPTVE